VIAPFEKSAEKSLGKRNVVQKGAHGWQRRSGMLFTPMSGAGGLHVGITDTKARAYGWKTKGRDSNFTT
jgi:hypothetical protein